MQHNKNNTNAKKGRSNKFKVEKSKLKIMNRLCIYTKDVQWITGKSERQSRNIINAIKQKLNKDKNQLVTIEEFCNHTGLDPATVKQQIR